jgi:hypothetical protein
MISLAQTRFHGHSAVCNLQQIISHIRATVQTPSHVIVLYVDRETLPAPRKVDMLVNHDEATNGKFQRTARLVQQSIRS